MSTSLEELKSNAARLSPSERAELAHHLLRSLEPDEEGAAEEWQALAEQRLAEILDGKLIGIPADEVIAALRNRRS